MPVAWKESVVVPIYKKGDKTDCTMYKLLSNILLSKKLLRIISVDFVATGQLLIIYSSFVKYVKKKIWGYNAAVHRLLIDFKPTTHLEGKSCIIFSLSLVHLETGKANKNVSD